VWTASFVIAPITIVTVINPAVSWACDEGLVWDPGVNACMVPESPPPGPGPVMMCIGKPTIYDEALCTPIGG